jgi:hypothetical protein
MTTEAHQSPETEKKTVICTDLDIDFKGNIFEILVVFSGLRMYALRYYIEFSLTQLLNFPYKSRTTVCVNHETKQKLL